MTAGADSMVEPAAFGLGISTWSEGGKLLDTYYAVVNLAENAQFAALVCEIAGVATDCTVELSAEVITKVLESLAPVVSDGGSHPNAEALEVLARVPTHPTGSLRTRRGVVLTCIGDLAAPPSDVHDVQLRLHLLSHCKVVPNSVNLDGIFGLLPNVVWTTLGPADPDGFDRLRMELRAEGVAVTVLGVDKFPRMFDYVIPAGVRAADADRVRLGAHLASGTTVMHEGYVNFNAGTVGNAMVEGRISAGVVVGEESDVGGGSSIMGTLSGGGTLVNSIGRRSLLGANAGIGISLGDDCIVEAGLYVTAGTLVTLPDGSVVKAKELSGRDSLLFRRNSRSGAVEVLSRGESSFVGLNEALHSND